jgi:hypothetical protein
MCSDRIKQANWVCAQQSPIIRLFFSLSKKQTHALVAYRYETQAPSFESYSLLDPLSFVHVRACVDKVFGPHEVSSMVDEQEGVLVKVGHIRAAKACGKVRSARVVVFCGMAWWSREPIKRQWHRNCTGKNTTTPE